MADMADVIREEAVSITVTRQAAPTYVAGRPVDGAEVTRTVRGVIVPVSGEAITRLPEGDSVSGSKRIISADQLFVADGDVPPDVITYGGIQWEVMDVDTWLDHTETYYDAIATKIGVR